MAQDIELFDRYEQMNAVAERYIKGEKIPAIVRATGLKRAEVLSYIDEYKEIARNDEETKDRAREALHSADKHFSLLIEESWNIIDTETDNKIRNVSIKNVADFEKARVDMLQKAGLYDDAALGDELAEMEEKQQMLIAILKEVTADCEKCKYEVARRLSKVTGKTESVVVSEVVTPTS